MPPNNRLAPPLRNSLASYVPAPLDPNMLPPEVSPRFGVGDYAENLSIGVGEGLTSRLRSAKQTLQDPVQAVKETAMAIRQMYDDPMLALQALRQLRQQIMSGPIGMGQAIGEMAPISIRGAPVMQELDVYHGTPHRFEPTPANPLGEFDASKIGTGEGAQAYGHGIYYAESPDVARSYATMNQASAPSRNSFIRLRDQAPQGSAEWKHYDNLAKEGLGSLYKADLPDEMIDRMLDWDKPLSEQPFKMRQAIFNDLTDAGYSKAVVNDLLNRKTGMEFFRILHTGLQQGESSAINLAKKLNLSEQEMFMDAPALASAVMRRMGIPGIKYLDAGSRGQGGSNTRNFVVFPGEEKKVRILERK